MARGTETIGCVERIAHVSHREDEARRWDLRQHRQMTPDERRRVAEGLGDRVYCAKCPDVRGFERSRKAT